VKPPASLFSFAWKTARRSLDPSGRASRSEVAHYVIAALLITFPVSLLTRIAMPYPVHHLVGNALDALLIMPVPALLARRCHDHGRSGHWAWLAVLALAVGAARNLVSALYGIETRIEVDRFIWPIDWAIILGNLALLALVLFPGTRGPNAYGPDPRSAAA
jgi:uncharacterized membrane protein YhaH (DUF805 family)